AISLWAAIRPPAIEPHADPAAAESTAPSRRPPLTRRRAWRQGFLSSLGNPKLAIFFSSLLPQFAPAGPGAFTTMLALGAIFVAMTLAGLSGYAVVVARAGNLVRRRRIRRALDGLLGTVLLAFGLRLATLTR